MVQRATLSGLARRALASALCVLLLAACPDGYPTEDVPQIEPWRTSQAQLLAALNELGAEPHLPRRWRYSLHPECELEASVRGDGRERRRVTLQGAEISSRAVDGVSEILLVPAGDSEAPGVDRDATVARFGSSQVPAEAPRSAMRAGRGDRFMSEREAGDRLRPHP